jgi:hypothetical protein
MQFIDLLSSILLTFRTKVQRSLVLFIMRSNLHTIMCSGKEGCSGQQLEYEQTP